MDRLWAPWRMEYIKDVDDVKGCFLCDIIAGKYDRKDLVLHRGSDAFVVMNKYPYNCGHLMVVPYEHTADMLKLSDACRNEMMLLCAKSMGLLGERLKSEGFNCGMNFGKTAGAGVRDHVHLHVVPRWNGDVNFFPVLSETKSMPQYLEETYDLLIDGFARLPV